MADAKKLHLTVITPARAVLDTDAQAVVVPAFDGEVGVLPDHAPLLALLGTGIARITLPDGSLRKLAVRGGFLQVNANRVTMLTPESYAPNEIQAEALQKEDAKLGAQLPTKPDERELFEARRAWLATRKKLIAKQPAQSGAH